jgi:hypothetical protein
MLVLIIVPPQDLIIIRLYPVIRLGLDVLGGESRIIIDPKINNTLDSIKNLCTNLYVKFLKFPIIY